MQSAQEIELGLFALTTIDFPNTATGRGLIEELIYRKQILTCLAGYPNRGAQVPEFDDAGGINALTGEVARMSRWPSEAARAL